MFSSSGKNTGKGVYIVDYTFDVIIIGAGPSGIFCAYELSQKKPDLRILMIEKGRRIEDRSCPKEKQKCVWAVSHVPLLPDLQVQARFLTESFPCLLMWAEICRRSLATKRQNSCWKNLIRSIWNLGRTQKCTDWMKKKKLPGSEKRQLKPIWN